MHRRTLRHILLLLLLLIAVAVPVPAAPASGGSSASSCVAGLLCTEEPDADRGWRAAAGLSTVPNRWQGDGVTVASIDTGVVPTADLGDRLVARSDFTDDHDGVDRFGHGTHMAGLIAGDGTLAGEAYEGAAPEARLVAVKVAGWDGASDVSTVIAALRWVTSHRERLGIRVVSLSWGTDAVQAADVDPLNAAIQRAWAAGLVVIVSAGNGGPEAGTITKPGDDPRVITVGAADTAGTPERSDDTVAAFSGRGSASAGEGKPDLVAPGISLASDRAPGSAADLLRPDARVGRHMFTGSGTSQAAAVVAGIAARMLDAAPTLTPDQVKAVLLATARGRPTGPGAGAGMVDAAAAIELAAAGGTLPSLRSPAPPSSGLGSLAASRGTAPAWADFDRTGVPQSLTGERTALGRPWRAESVVSEDWTPATWTAEEWAPYVAEVRGSAAAALWTGPALPWLGAGPEPWGLRAPPADFDALWAAKYWGAKYWGAWGWQ